MEPHAKVTFALNTADLLDSEDECLISYNLPTPQQNPPLPPLHLKRLGSCPARPTTDASNGPQPVRDTVAPRRQCSLLSSLASIDELQPLELDCPSPVVAPSPCLNAYQVADLMRNIARNCPGGALTPLHPNTISSATSKCADRLNGPSPAPCAQPFTHSAGSLGAAACAAYPLPPGPPRICTRVGQKKPASSDLATDPRMPKLKIRTPRRHFGTALAAAAAAPLRREEI